MKEAISVAILLILYGFGSVAAETNKSEIANILSDVVSLQGLGQEKTVDELRKRCAQKGRAKIDTMKICRLLFKRRGHAIFRPPLIGQMHFVGDTDYEDWPLSPIAVYEGVPISVVNGLSLFGFPESEEEYLDYCLKNCEWNDFRFTKKSDEQIRGTVEKFMTESEWNRPLHEIEREFLIQQAANSEQIMAPKP